jgi:hypothetical protein
VIFRFAFVLCVPTQDIFLVEVVARGFPLFTIIIGIFFCSAQNVLGVL